MTGVQTCALPIYFSDRRVRDHREDDRHTTQIFQNTTVVNNYNYGGAHNTIVNNGISVDRVSAATHQPVQAVPVNELPNAARHGWRGEERSNRAPGGSANPAANNASLHQNGGGVQNGVVGSPVIVDANGQRGHGSAIKDSSAPARNQNYNPAVNNNNVSTETGHQSVRRMGAPVVSQTQNQNAPASVDNNRAQHSSRQEQQRSWQQNQTQPVTPSISTAPPQRSQLQVEQSQVIHPQTRAQMGTVLERNQSAQPEQQQRSQWRQQQQPSGAVIEIGRAHV